MANNLETNNENRVNGSINVNGVNAHISVPGPTQEVRDGLWIAGAATFIFSVVSAVVKNLTKG